MSQSLTKTWPTWPSKRTAGKATQPCGYGYPATSTLSLPTLCASTQRERQPSPVSSGSGKGNPALPSSLFRRIARLHSGKGNPDLRLQAAGKATQSCLRSGKGDPALRSVAGKGNPVLRCHNFQPPFCQQHNPFSSQARATPTRGS